MFKEHKHPHQLVLASEYIPDSVADIKFDSEAQTTHKTCTKCLLIKPLTEFHKKGKRLDSRCADCVGQSKKKIRDAKKRKKATRKTTKVIDVDSLRIQEYIFDKTTVSTDHFSVCLRNYVMDVILKLGSNNDDEIKSE